MCRRYKDQPDLTALKFCDIEREGEKVRMYRSGDRGFLHEDGRLSIGGRISSREVKLRGFRIDLAELEKGILKTNPEILMISVQIHEDSLVAFVVPSSIDCTIVKERISKDVPAFSVPTKIIALDELPMNSNGKIDHSQVALLNPLAESKQSIAGSVTSQQLGRVSRLANNDKRTRTPISDSAVHSAISKLWMTILALKSPPADDVTFFEVGGHR